MLVKESQEYGKISLGNTKMPGTTYAVDAFACLTGKCIHGIGGSRHLSITQTYLAIGLSFFY